MDKKKKLFYELLFIISIIYFILVINKSTKAVGNVEEIDISIGIGFGIDIKNDWDIKYRIPINSILYSDEKSSDSEIHTGIARTEGETREYRQLGTNKKFFLGTERVYMIEKDLARFGIGGMTNILYNDTLINDNGVSVVCEGRCEDYFNYKIKGFNSSVEFIEGLIKNSTLYDFSGEDYKLRDVFLKTGSKDKNLVLPYIMINNKGIMLMGDAIFQNDRLKLILDNDESRIMNMLRGSNTKGLINVLGEDNKAITYNAKAKKKVKCNKANGKYNFVIEVELRGDINSNTLYNNKKSDEAGERKIESKLEQVVSDECKSFVDKMQNVYKFDCLDLSKYVAAKYGLDEADKFEKNVQDASVIVNVRVKVDKFGRGFY